jgi:hypothetical protein
MTLAAIVYSVDSKIMKSEEIGRFVLVGGKLEMHFPCDPGRHPPGEGMASPIEILEEMRTKWAWLGPERDKKITAAEDPERWLRGLAIRYHGTYFWVKIKEKP